MKKLIWMTLFALSSCATTFGVLSEKEEAKYLETIETSLETQGEKVKSKVFYSTASSPSVFKNTFAYSIEELSRESGSCDPFQSSVYGYSIRCKYKIRATLTDMEKEEVSKTFRLKFTFKDTQGLKKSLEGALLNQVLMAHFSSNDPLKGLREKHKDYIGTVERRSIAKGMPEALIEISWGKPKKINLYSAGARKQYIYDNHYIYVENGVISNWQKF